MQSISESVNGKDYEMIPFGASRSLSLATKIASTFKSQEEIPLDPKAIAINIISNEKFPDLVKELVSEFTCGGKKISFDSHFGENKKDLLPCLGISLRENIIPFFDQSALETLIEITMGDLL